MSRLCRSDTPVMARLYSPALGSAASPLTLPVRVRAPRAVYTSTSPLSPLSPLALEPKRRGVGLADAYEELMYMDVQESSGGGGVSPRGRVRLMDFWAKNRILQRGIMVRPTGSHCLLCAIAVHGTHMASWFDPPALILCSLFNVSVCCGT